jgi:hypothetical protein
MITISELIRPTLKNVHLPDSNCNSLLSHDVLGSCRDMGPNMWPAWLL